MLDSLNKLFDKIELSWIDSITDIENSNEFSELVSIFPNLKRIFDDAREKNRDEIQRTIKHIFRSYKIFFLMVNGKFYHETLSNDSITKIQEKVMNQHSQNQLIIPILLMYHDIGRYIDNKQHPYHSYYLISNKDLLESFELLDMEKLLIKKLIHYHLLIATIYTGESTFYGIYSLLNDLEFIDLISDINNISRFLNLLEVFTIIDILGYPYTQIFDHYLKYYEEINSKLKKILNFWPDKDQALNTAKQYSQEWLKWRIAGALRIFQFVETKPYLTKEFYFNKLKESIKESNNNFLYNLTWKLIKNKYLVHSYKIQLKYSLALLMILAFGNFQRMGLKINAGISYKLLLFWIFLSKEVKTRSKEYPNSLWNIFLEGMPHWSEINNSFINMLKDDIIEFLIKNSKDEYDHEKKEYNLYIDFNKIIRTLS